MATMRLIIVLLTLLLPEAARAGVAPVLEPSALCESAIVSAEYGERLPPRLLAAIATVESGRPDARTGSIRPWPWTINAEGAGQFFATKAEAVAAVRALQAQGVRSIDVGCMQISLLYHPAAFASLEAAFDPRSNTTYAAHFLNSLYAVSGDWLRATGAYHSETPALGDAYRAMVLARWERPGLSAAPRLTTAYRDFQPIRASYAAFPPPHQIYGAFAVPGPKPIGWAQ